MRNSYVFALYLYKLQKDNFSSDVCAQVTSFSVGDIVKILDQVHEVKKLQRGHGEWTDSMKDVSATFNLPFDDHVGII